MAMIRTWRIRWSFFIGTTVGAFILMNWSAQKSGNQFTRWLRWGFGIHPLRRRRLFLVPLFNGFLSWLSIHICTKYL